MNKEFGKCRVPNEKEVLAYALFHEAWIFREMQKAVPKFPALFQENTGITGLSARMMPILGNLPVKIITHLYE